MTNHESRRSGEPKKAARRLATDRLANDVERSQKVVTVIGFIDSAGRLHLEPGYSISGEISASRTQRPEREPITVAVAGPQLAEPSPEQVLNVEVLDNRREVTARKIIPMEALCLYGGPSERFWFFNDTIAVIPDARQIQFKWLGEVRHIVNIPERPPTAQLEWNPPQTVDGVHQIHYTGRSSSQAALRYTLMYSHDDGINWRPICFSSDQTRQEVNFDELPGGNARLMVLVTDGVNTASAKSESFQVRQKGYRSFILAPQDGAVAYAGEPVMLIGQGWHYELGKPERENLTWYSSRDGEIGRGGCVEARFSPGQHELTLTTDPDANRGISSISISIQERRRL